MEREQDSVDVMRYVDGEMDAAERAAFEVRMTQDEALGRQVERERALRQLLQGTYAPVVEEPVPARLHAALAPKVISLNEARARRRGWPTWAALGGVAASVLLVLIGGRQWLMSTPNVEAGAMAQGELAQLLDAKLSGDKVGQLTAGLSFVAKGGAYCRTFATNDLGGVACHEQAGWRVRELAPLDGKPGAAPEYRTAATALPPAVLRAVDDLREGDVLDARQEAEVKAKGWR